MQLGMVGLGKMGRGMALRLAAAGHEIAGFDRDAAARAALSGDGLTAVDSLRGLRERLTPPRVIWLMAPAGAAVDAIIAGIGEPGPEAVFIDGGNSNFRDSQRRHRELAARGIGFVDVGVSGGVWGQANGYCLTIGGAPEAVERLRPLFAALAPAPAEGWSHVGPAGAGHFVKMVHNGIEYGVMQALAEGFALMEKHPDYDLNLAEIARTWNQGSVIRSWLLELAERALADDPRLADMSARVDDSGEGRWMAAEAIAADSPAPIITHALIARLQSRDAGAFAPRLLSALRFQFGGHRPAAEK